MTEQNQNMAGVSVQPARSVPTTGGPVPACVQQAPFEPIGDPSQPDTQYQHVFRVP